MRSSLALLLAFPEGDDLGLADSPVVVRWPGASPLVPTAVACGREVAATLCASSPFLGISAVAVGPSWCGPAFACWVTGATVLPVPCVGFCSLPGRIGFWILAAFWARKASQADLPLSRSVLRIVSVTEKLAELGA